MNTPINWVRSHGPASWSKSRPDLSTGREFTGEESSVANGRAPENMSIWQMKATLVPRRRGLLHRATVFASGVPWSVYRLVPEENTEFIVQGTGVLIAFSLAVFSSFVAQGLMFASPPSLLTRSLISLAFGFLILSVDRSLVRTSLRPHHFPPDVVNSLWDPYADVKWYEVISGQRTKSSPLKGFRSIFGIIAKIAARFMLAFLVSWIVADVVAIYVFKPTVDQAGISILVAEKQSAKDSAQKAYNSATRAASNLLQTRNAVVNADPAVVQARAAYDANSKNATNIEIDIGSVNSVIYAEEHKQKGFQVKLLTQNGKLYPPGSGTSGVDTCGPRCVSDKALLSTLTKMKQPAEDDKATSYSALTTAISSSQRKNGVAVSSSTSGSVDASALRDLNAAKAKADKMDTSASGLDLLVRRAALDRLVQEKTPWDPAGGSLACSQNASWICSIRNTVFPMTPMGSFVSAFRWILFLIDVLPIILKVLYSFKGRRPYEVLLAAFEEVSIADTMNKLDAAVSLTGSDMERRADVRRAGRAISGARVIREEKRSRLQRRDDIEREVLERLRGRSDRRAGMRVRLREFYETKSAVRRRSLKPDILVANVVARYEEPKIYDQEKDDR